MSNTITVTKKLMTSCSQADWLVLLRNFDHRDGNGYALRATPRVCEIISAANQTGADRADTGASHPKAAPANGGKA